MSGARDLVNISTQVVLLRTKAFNGIYAGFRFRDDAVCYMSLYTSEREPG